MRIRSFFMGLALALTAFAAAGPAPARAEAEAKGPSRVVMTWMPPYSRSVSWAQLQATYQGVGPSTALTHLGLQLWVPSADGGLTRPTRYDAISDEEIRSYVAWAKARKIKVMLTVYNGENDWDWPLAKNAFAANKAKFIAALLAEMTRMKLDGIDVDLEAAPYDPTPDDKATYLAFIKDLSAELRARKKSLQIDSFHYIYNAPNQTWWPDLFPLVDVIASMGYEDLGRSAPDWHSYEAQRAAAGSKANMSKLIIGVPTNVDSWQGDDAINQVKWFVSSKKRVGVGLWDAQNEASAFRAKPVWNVLEKIRDQN